jgi:nucleotide-binding universal stress UspA family protein
MLCMGHRSGAGDQEAVMTLVVVGVDGSDNARAALRWAAEQARVQGADLRAVFVWQFPYMDIVPTTLVATLPPYHEMQKAAEERLREIVDTADLPAEVRVERVVVEGLASRALLDEAKDADLLVVGARGHGGFVGMVTGSVATHVVNHASVPVAVVRA